MARMRQEKDGSSSDIDLSSSVAALHLTLRSLRGTVRATASFRGLSMRDLSSKLLKRFSLGVALAALLGVASVGQANAANPLELNFWLSGPRYDGRVAPCEAALGTITAQFHEKESMYWNSALTITGYGNIHEVAFRPWQSANIPRRYCAGELMTSDGKQHTVNFSIIEDGGFAGYDQGVEWCVTGLDRDWAYNPNCRAAGP
jgi:hypothetical protein